MRILHTSDWHLGASLNNMPLLGEQQNFLRQLYQIVEREQIDTVLVAGDVFDHAVSNADAISLYNEAMTTLCIDMHIPVLVCAGNHDGAARLSSCGKLLERAGLYVAGGIRDGIREVEICGASFHLLPYFSIDEARYLYPGEEIKSYHDAMQAVAASMQTEGKSNILVAHCFVTGAQTSESDRSAMVGGANMVNAGAFSAFDYVALGHLHRAQDIGGNVRYSGSPVKLSFAEAGAEKSVTVVDTADFSRREVPVRMERDLRVLKGNYSELLDAAEADPRREDYIKIELRDEYAHMEILNTFRNFYPNLLSLAGKQVRETETSLTVEEASSLRPEDIMAMFCREYTGEEPDEAQKAWFRRALEAQQKGGEAE